MKYKRSSLRGAFFVYTSEKYNGVLGNSENTFLWTCGKGDHAMPVILFLAWLLILISTSSILLIVAYTTINPIILLSLLPVVILLSVLAFDRG